jgi:glucose-1-phosphate thymidylyltransferase
MKALILSGGKGTRLKPITHTGAKQLVPVANKPILFYVIENIIDAGITDIGVVVSPETGSVIKEKVEAATFPVQFTWLEQSYPGGLAHAVKISQPFLGESSFIMYLGDNLLQSPVAPMVEKFYTSSAQAAILLKGVEKPESFGVATLDQNGRVLQLEEKPKNPKSNLALVGVYLFQPTIHNIIAKLKPSARGELEITDALQQLVLDGAKVDSNILEGWWLDTGKKEDLLDANYVVLDDWIKRDVQGTTLGVCSIRGRVSVAPGSRIIGSTLVGPCVIGKDCVIHNSHIGAFTSIGDKSLVADSRIDYSVLMGLNTVRKVSQLDSSLLAENVIIHGGGYKTEMIASLGEDSEVHLR